MSEPGDVAGEVVVGCDQTLAALLCELWRSEEERFGCARDAQGIITCKFSLSLVSNYKLQITLVMRQMANSSLLTVESWKSRRVSNVIQLV